MLFTKSRCPYERDPWINTCIAKLLKVSIEQAKRSTQDKSSFAALVETLLVQLHGNRFTVLEDFNCTNLETWSLT